jgi:hypothetical protein
MGKINLLNKRDFIVILIISLLCGVFLIFQQKTGEAAIISVDGKVVKEIFLKSADNGEFTVDEAKGTIFEITDGKIRITEACCPDRLCVSKGYISKPHETIICLPNRIVVEIKGAEKDDKFDAVAG